MGKKQNRAAILAPPCDEHCGSLEGLMLPEPWNKEEGGTHTPTRLQQDLGELWLGGWERIKQLRKELDARLIIANNGDAVEGVHNGLKGLVSVRRGEHERIFIACLERALGEVGFNPKRGDKLAFIRGTDTHVADSEENIARDLSTPNGKPMALPVKAGKRENNYKDGRYLWRTLNMSINGRAVVLAHKGVNPGTKKVTESNQLYHKAKDLYLRYTELDLQPPRYAIYAHHHNWVPPVKYSGEKGAVEVIALPCFQFKTEWAETVGAVDKFTSLGMWWAVIMPDGETKWYTHRIKVGPQKVIKV